MTDDTGTDTTADDPGIEAIVRASRSIHVAPLDGVRFVRAARARRRRNRTIISSVLAAAVVVAGVSVATAGSSPSPSNSVDAADQSDAPNAQPVSGVVALRDDAAAAGEKFVIAVNTYGPDDLSARGTLDGYADRVRDVVTDTFADSFDKKLSLAEQSVAEAGYERTVQTFGRGVTFLSESAADVLVVGVINGSYPDTSNGAATGARVDSEPQPFRFEVSVTRVDSGTWLVDDVTPLEDTVEYVDDGKVAGELIEDEAVAARSAAVSAVPAILSYDYRTLDDALAEGLAVMTDAYGSTYTEQFETVIRANAPRTRTVVTTTVLKVGIIESDVRKVMVLVAFDRPTTNGDTRQRDVYVYEDQATVTMVDVDGTWLVDDIASGTG